MFFLTSRMYKSSHIKGLKPLTGCYGMFFYLYIKEKDLWICLYNGAGVLQISRNIPYHGQIAVIARVLVYGIWLKTSRTLPVTSRTKTQKVVDQMKITNEKQYLEALARLIAGAEYIEADEFERLPLWKQKKARERYDEIEHAILKYQGVI